MARFTPLQRIETAGGEVIRAWREDEDDTTVVREAYLSRVDPYSVRAWKLHTRRTVNAVVPTGHVRFVVVADPDADEPVFEIHDLGQDHPHGRLSITPGSWFGFQGGAEGGLVLNLADHLHDPDEAQSRPLDAFDGPWLSDA